MSFVVNKQKIAEILMEDEPQALESEFDLEDLLAAIDSLNNKVKFLEQLKKQRSKSIQAEIDKIQAQDTRLRDVVMLTMNSVDKKSLNFPGVGRVSVKEGRKTWIISDEGELIQKLYDELGEDDFNRIVQERRVIISKKDMNPILDNWESVNKLPDCVTKKVNAPSVTVTISKDAEITQEYDVIDTQEDDDSYEELKI